MAKKNFPISTVATAPSPSTSGTSLIVETGHGSRFAINEPAQIFPANEQPISSNAEIVMITNIDGDTLTIERIQEGTTARNVQIGDIIMQGFTAKDWNDLVALATHDNRTDLDKVSGTNTGDQDLSDLALKSNVLELDNTDAFTPDADYEPATKKYVDESVAIGMNRQALINGNFNIWQRGTSVSLSDAVFTYLADRWVDYHAADGGTLPTLTRSRQILTSGELFGSFYYSRLTTNGAGTSLGNNAVGQLGQNIEFGTRYLCGDGKKITVSFWARSSIAGKRIGIRAIQNYGTGGSPSSNEIINGSNWTLTSTWTKYTYTFTTNTLVGKTFGTNNDDSFQIFLTYMWGSTRQAQYGASSAESYVGSGTIDIAQIQICTGEEALPFSPIPIQKEWESCQRYFQQSGSYYTLAVYGVGNGYVVAYERFPVRMRINPAVTLTSPTPTNNKVWIGGADKSATTYTWVDGFTVTLSEGSGLTGNCAFNWEATADL